MQRRHILALATLLLPAAVMAQVEQKQSAVSGIQFPLTSDGVLGLDYSSNAAGFITPRGSSTSYLFGSGLWFGARRKVTDTSGAVIERRNVFITYNPSSGRSWASPGNRGEGDARQFLHHSVEHDRLTGAAFAPGDEPWPLWLAQNETATTLTPGTYLPTLAQRTPGALWEAPAFLTGRSDEEMVARFHDGELSRYEIGEQQAIAAGYPLGLQIQKRVYGWQGGRYRNVVVVQYEVRNVGGDTLHDCVLGEALDPDLGNPENDHVAWFAERPELRAVRAWTEPETAGAYGELVLVLVEAPVVDSSGFVDNPRRTDFESHGRIGSFPEWTLDSNPATDGDRYDFMTSGSFAKDGPERDYRAILASTTFSMRPGDVAHFAVAYAVLDGTFGRNSGDTKRDLRKAGPDDDQALADFAQAIITDYYRGYLNSLAVASAAPMGTSPSAMTLAPTPARDRLEVTCDLSSIGAVLIRLVDPIGRVVATVDGGMHDGGEYRRTLDVTGLSDGSYGVVVSCGTSTSVGRTSIVR